MAKKFAELYDTLSTESRQWVEEQVKVEGKKMALSELRKAQRHERSGEQGRYKKARISFFTGNAGFLE